MFAYNINYEGLKPSSLLEKLCELQLYSLPNLSLSVCYWQNISAPNAIFYFHHSLTISFTLYFSLISLKLAYLYHLSFSYKIEEMRLILSLKHTDLLHLCSGVAHSKGTKCLRCRVVNTLNGKDYLNTTILHLLLYKGKEI